MVPRSQLAVALAILGLLAGCANRDGLRVEGTAPAASETSAPRPAPTKSIGIKLTKEPTAVPTRAPTTEPKRVAAASVALSPAQLRVLLLADTRVDRDAKAMLTTCKEKCLARGIVTDLVGRGSPQRVVTVNMAANGYVFAAYLVGDVANRPSVLSVIRGDDMRITAGKERSLVVESKVYGPSDPICCPSGSKVEIYRWNGNYLVRTSEVFKKGS